MELVLPQAKHNMCITLQWNLPALDRTSRVNSSQVLLVQDKKTTILVFSERYPYCSTFNTVTTALIVPIVTTVTIVNICNTFT